MKPIKVSKNNTYLDYDISIISEYDPKIQLEKNNKSAFSDFKRKNARYKSK